MSSKTVNHEYNESGTLHLVSGFNSDNKDDTKSYWLRVHFKHITPYALYFANFNDSQIRGFCGILQFDPELLYEFMTNKPELKIQQENIIIEFNLRIVSISKVYSFNIQIPKHNPTGSSSEVIELRQQNNILTRRIKTLEEKLTNIETMCAKSHMEFADVRTQLEQQNNILTQRIKTLEERCTNNELMFAKSYMNTQWCLYDRIKIWDEQTIMHCVELCGENSKIFHKMCADITLDKRITDSSYDDINTPNNRGEIIVELLKKGKLPQLKKYISDGKHQDDIYRALINKYLLNGEIDKLLHFCQLEIKTTTYVSDNLSEYKLLQHFENTIGNSPHLRDLLTLPDFLQKCELVRKLLIKIQT